MPKDLPPVETDAELHALIQHITHLLEHSPLDRTLSATLLASRQKLENLASQVSMYQRTSQRTRQALDTSAMGIWDWELDTGRLTIDPTIKALLGYYDSDIDNTLIDWSNHVHPEDRQNMLYAVHSHLEGTTSVMENEHRVMHRDGSIRWLLMRGAALRDQQGYASQLVGTYTDITERKSSESLLEESEQRFRELADVIPEVFLLAEPGNSKLLYISPAYARIWGRPAQTLYEDPISFFDNIHPDDQEYVRQFYNSVVATSTGHNDIEYRIIRPDNRERWIRASFFPVLNSEGAVYRIAGVCEDITERKFVEHKTVELTREREQVKVLVKFMEDASHDFRTPLTVINNNIYLLEMVADAEQKKNLITGLKKQVANLTNLLDSMLTMARLDTGAKLLLQPVDMNKLIHECCQQLETVIERKDIRVRLDLASHLPLIQADQDKLKRAVSNILWNAIRYNRTGGTIIIRSWVRHDYVVSEISDTGIGISKENLARIFERFYRVDEARPANADTGGAGLGLPIAKSIIEAHGGFLDADSAEGVGSTFRMSLPLEARHNG